MGVRWGQLVEGPRDGATAITVTHLQMTQAPDQAASAAPNGVYLREVTGTNKAISRQLYLDIGAAWGWVDRQDWSLEQWTAWTDRPQHHLLVALDGNDVIGYAELDQCAGGSVELAFFGLYPMYHGRGIGRWLLEQAIALAWSLPGTQACVVHTCDLDATAALGNYLARGFAVTHREIEWRLTATDSVQP